MADALRRAATRLDVRDAGWDAAGTKETKERPEVRRMFCSFDQSTSGLIVFPSRFLSPALTAHSDVQRVPRGSGWKKVIFHGEGAVPHGSGHSCDGRAMA